MSTLTRRELLKMGGAGAAMLAATGGVASAQAASAPAAAEAKKERWSLCINTSTIRPASLEEKVEFTAKAGYDAIELWIDDLAGYEKSGKSLDDLAKRIKDLGLTVPNVIGIWNSMPVNEADKPKAHEEAKRRLALAAKVGAKHIAAVPGPDRPDIDVLWAAQRYGELVDLGKEVGVGVGLEFLGFAKGIHTLGQAVAIAMESGRPDASVVADTYHIHRGGGSFAGAALTSGAAYAVWHINDVPAQPAAAQLQDSDRLYPGDGILPLAQLLKDLWKVGFRGPLSIEIFSREEWKKPLADVAKTGIEKMRAVIAKSGVGA